MSLLGFAVSGDGRPNWLGDSVTEVGRRANPDAPGPSFGPHSDRRGRNFNEAYGGQYRYSMVTAAEAAMSAVVAVVAKADTPAMVGPPATAEALVGGATSGPEKPQRKPGPMERANIQLQDQLGPYASVNHVVVCSRVRFMS